MVSRLAVTHHPSLDIGRLPVRPRAETSTGTDASRPRGTGPLHAERRNVADIPRETWDALAGLTPWATPFSGWAFQRAWWDAYGENAHDETLVVCADGPRRRANPSRSCRSCTATRSSRATR